MWEELIKQCSVQCSELYLDQDGSYHSLFLCVLHICDYVKYLFFNPFVSLLLALVQFQHWSHEQLRQSQTQRYIHPFISRAAEVMACKTPMAFKAGHTTRRAEDSRLQHYGDFTGILPHYRGQPKTGGQWQNTLSAPLKCSLQGLQLGMNLTRMHSVFKGIMLLMEVKVLGISTEVIGGTKCWLFDISICNMTCSLL